MDAVLRKSADASVKSSAAVSVDAAGVRAQLMKCVLCHDQVINTPLQRLKSYLLCYLFVLFIILYLFIINKHLVKALFSDITF